MVRGMRCFVVRKLQNEAKLSKNDSVVCKVRRWISLHLVYVKEWSDICVYLTLPTSRTIP